MFVTISMSVARLSAVMNLYVRIRLAAILAVNQSTQLIGSILRPGWWYGAKSERNLEIKRIFIDLSP